MDNNLTKTTCCACKKEFYYCVTDMGVPGGKDREFIYCPYCRQNNGSFITSGFVYTYKLESLTK